MSLKPVGVLNPEAYANFQTTNKHMHIAINSLFGAE